jgi:hypothetical protein
MKTSLTGLGAVVVTMLNLILPMLGVNVDAGTTEGLVVSIINVIGFITLVYGQYRRGDVKGFIFKK